MSISRKGNSTILLDPAPSVIRWAAVVGKKEKEGPMGACFGQVFEEKSHPEGSFEEEEQELVRQAFQSCVSGAARPEIVFGGDLLNQCVSTAFAMRDQNLPYAGLYGACSTMAEGLALSGLFVSAGAAERAAAVTASHFCTAERQYRSPLNYGSQKPQTAQRTVTGSGAVLTGRAVPGKPLIGQISFGRVVDYGIKDANDMGAAMAPAAAETLLHFFSDTGTGPEAYDRIFTGDLGREGSSLLQRLMEKEDCPLGREYEDCGALIFDPETQDTHSGGSGCGCSAAMLCGHILPQLEKGVWQKVLFVATGALMSPTTTMQGESIPGVAHLVCLDANLPN